MQVSAKKRSVGRGASLVNTKGNQSYMADKTVSNIAIKKQSIAPARAIAMIKNPNLETITESIEWILADYVRLHDLKLSEKSAGSK